jgi:hypothetical protein
LDEPGSTDFQLFKAGFFDSRGPFSLSDFFSNQSIASEYLIYWPWKYTEAFFLFGFITQGLLDVTFWDPDPELQ